MGGERPRGEGVAVGGPNRARSGIAPSSRRSGDTMHNKSIWRAWLLAALAVLAPGAAFAQGIAEDYAPADPTFPFPLYSTHPEAGGLFTFARVRPYSARPTRSSQNRWRCAASSLPRPIVPDQHQHFSTSSIPGVTQSGTFVGSGQEALDVNQVRGNSGWTPGLQDAASAGSSPTAPPSIDWMHLIDASTMRRRHAVPRAAPTSATTSPIRFLSLERLQLPQRLRRAGE